MTALGRKSAETNAAFAARILAQPNPAPHQADKARWVLRHPELQPSAKAKG